MERKFGFLCDFAQDAGGKLTAVGIGIDRIYATDIPTVHANLGIVVAIGYSIAEAGTKHLVIRLLDADGGDIRDSIDIQVPFPAPDGSTLAEARAVVNIQALKLPAYGDYAVHLTVDGLEIARLPFSVAPPPQTS